MPPPLLRVLLLVIIDRLRCFRDDDIGTFRRLLAEYDFTVSRGSDAARQWRHAITPKLDVILDGSPSRRRLAHAHECWVLLLVADKITGFIVVLLDWLTLLPKRGLQPPPLCFTKYDTSSHTTNTIMNTNRPHAGKSSSSPRFRLFPEIDYYWRGDFDILDIDERRFDARAPKHFFIRILSPCFNAYIYRDAMLGAWLCHILYANV